MTLNIAMVVIIGNVSSFLCNYLIVSVVWVIKFITIVWYKEGYDYIPFVGSVPFKFKTSLNSKSHAKISDAIPCLFQSSNKG